MPGYDRSGPEGKGPMTGRGMGNCGGYPPARTGRSRFGRFGMAFRHGRRRFYQPMWDFEPEYAPDEDDKEWLQQEEKYLKKQLEAIQNRLKGTEENPEG